MSNNYQDAGHRPHARHTNEDPRNEIVEAPYHLSVTLDTWGPVEKLFLSIYDSLQANWGDMPSRTMDRFLTGGFDPSNERSDWPEVTGWNTLTVPERKYVEACFARRTLQQVLERITFSFLIDGCSRACTHQLVRTRIGAAMMQHGGRDNDWRHRPWVMPETIRRACQLLSHEEWVDGGLEHCIVNRDPIDRLLNDDMQNRDLHTYIENYLQLGRDLYAALVDAGIPWEDARRLLWMGTATYIHIDYNYIALRDVLANRLEHVMDWEINCVAQLMLREVKMKCPPLFSKYLGSHSDLAGQAKFAGLQSWPPDGKYPNPYERCHCGHTKANHTWVEMPNGGQSQLCDVCDRDGVPADVLSQYHVYSPVDTLPREHRPEQNPFWILHPESMAGGPIVWVPTNGTYPEDLKPKEKSHGEVTSATRT